MTISDASDTGLGDNLYVAKHHCSKLYKLGGDDLKKDHLSSKCILLSHKRDDIKHIEF